MSVEQPLKLSETITLA